MLNRPATFTNPSKCSPSSARSSTTNSRHGAKSRGAVVASGSGRELGDLQKLGLNQLQTSLRVALTAEDYSKAAQIKQRLSEVGLRDDAQLDFRQYGILDWLAERAEQLGFSYPTDVQQSYLTQLQAGKDCLLQAPTGSGKTLAFLLPTLSRLDYAAAGAHARQGCQLVVIANTRELGVQTALLIYKLFGGSISHGIPGNSANMYRYSGPRGLQVRGLLDQQDVEAAQGVGVLEGTDVLVATPQALAEVLAQQGLSAAPSLSCLVVDEADACFQEHPQAMQQVLQAACCTPGRSKPQVVLVGATLGPSIESSALQMGWLHDEARRESHHSASTSDSPSHLPDVAAGVSAELGAGTQHRVLVVPASRKLAAVARRLRADVEQQGIDRGPPRVIVFAESEEGAVKAASPLRSALWGVHKLAVLLPSGLEPIKAMHAFRDNAATLLLATGSASRGLDLPGVTHIVNLGMPSSAVEYLHRAGRVGRLGSLSPGVVTTVVAEEEPAELTKLQEVAAQLNLQLEQDTELQPDRLPMDADLETSKHALEDMFNLM